MSAAALGELELLVLLATIQLDGDGYPLTIRELILERTKRRPSRAAVFITLARLEEKGLVRSSLGEPTPVRGGRAKRFFRAERSGRVAARQALGNLQALAGGLAGEAASRVID